MENFGNRNFRLWNFTYFIYHTIPRFIYWVSHILWNFIKFCEISLIIQQIWNFMALTMKFHRYTVKFHQMLWNYGKIINHKVWSMVNMISGLFNVMKFHHDMLKFHNLDREISPWNFGCRSFPPLKLMLILHQKWRRK